MSIGGAQLPAQMLRRLRAGQELGVQWEIPPCSKLGSRRARSSGDSPSCRDGERHSCCWHRDTGEVPPGGAGGSWRGGTAWDAALGMQPGMGSVGDGSIADRQHPGSALAASRCAPCDGLASATGTQKGLPHRWPPATPQNCLLTALAASQKAPTTLQRGSASTISWG